MQNVAYCTLQMEQLVALVGLSPEGLFSSVRTDMLFEITESGEEFGAAEFITVECLASVQSLVCFQPARIAQYRTLPNLPNMETTEYRRDEI